MKINAMAFATLALAAHQAAARADNLSLPVQKHTVACPSLAACPLRKPAGVSGWELLTKDAVLQEKGEGVWLADLSKVKPVAGKITVQLLTADGALIQIEAKVAK